MRAFRGLHGLFVRGVANKGATTCFGVCVLQGLGLPSYLAPVIFLLCLGHFSGG